MKLELYYAIKPRVINQEYGVYRPEIYSQFGFTRHNGEDERLADDLLIRAQLPCEAYKTQWQPRGGGLVLSVLSTESYEFEDGKIAWVLIDYLHLKELRKMPGKDYKINVGDVIAVGDNTGFSTGPHCHIQYRRVYKTPNGLVNVDSNDANNSFDPKPFYNGKYARDHAFQSIFRQLLDIKAKLSTFLLMKGR